MLVHAGSRLCSPAGAETCAADDGSGGLGRRGADRLPLVRLLAAAQLRAALRAAGRQPPGQQVREPLRGRGALLGLGVSSCRWVFCQATPPPSLDCCFKFWWTGRVSLLFFVLFLIGSGGLTRKGSRPGFAEVSSGVGFGFVLQLGDSGHVPHFCQSHPLTYWRIILKVFLKRNTNRK